MHFFIPTPTNSKLELGVLTVHYYALCILLGIICAYLLTKKRYLARGGAASEVSDLLLYLVPIGIIGGRLYHVISSPDAYFGKNGNALAVFKIWEGGMGIWGAVALATLAAYLYFQRHTSSVGFAIFADSVAPALLIGQAIGRFGNWFNAELFGKPSTLPWALEIPLEKRPDGFAHFSTFHPTFLYEALWSLLCALILIYLPTVIRLKPGRLFIAYIALYSFGRFWIESIRIDSAHRILGLRLNMWVAATAFLSATVVLAISLREKSES